MTAANEYRNWLHGCTCPFLEKATRSAAVAEIADRTALEILGAGVEGSYGLYRGLEVVPRVQHKFLNDTRCLANNRAHSDGVHAFPRFRRAIYSGTQSTLRISAVAAGRIWNHPPSKFLRHSLRFFRKWNFHFSHTVFWSISCYLYS